LKSKLAHMAMKSEATSIQFLKEEDGRGAGGCGGGDAETEGEMTKEV
jgi:hypothetical protein